MAILYYEIDYADTSNIEVSAIKTASSFDEMLKNSEMDQDDWALECREGNDGKWEISTLQREENEEFFDIIVSHGIDKPDNYDYIDAADWGILFLDDNTKY